MCLAKTLWLLELSKKQFAAEQQVHVCAALKNSVDSRRHAYTNSLHELVDIHPKSLIMFQNLVSKVRRRGKDGSASSSSATVQSSSITSPTASYEYRHLKEGHIRLLILEPAANPGDQISLSQTEVFLSPDLKYFALSYSWDAHQASCLVKCEGRELFSTPNCEAAMKRLRKIGEGKHILLWIDSICINQKDVEERNSQVKIMGDIYKFASTVVIWLGESDDYTNIALGTLKLVNISLEEGEGSHERHQRMLAQIFASLEKERRERGTDPLKELFKRSWFHRMWTVQESVLAKSESCTVLCGDAMIEWQQLLRAAQELQKKGYTEGCTSEAIQLQSYLGTYTTLQKFSRTAIQTAMECELEISFTPELSRLLWLARTKGATDPKDKVLALYGLVTQLGIPAPIPDYKKTVEEVYREWSEACIMQDKNLRVLYHVSTLTRLPNLLSWVPDWSQSNSLDHFRQVEGNTDWGSSRSRSSGGSRSWVSFSKDLQRRLILRTKFVDRIKVCTNRGSHSTIQYMKNAGWMQGPKDESDTDARMQEYSKIIALLRQWIEAAEKHCAVSHGEDFMAAFQLVLKEGQNEEEDPHLHPGPLEPATKVMPAIRRMFAAAFGQDFCEPPYGYTEDALSPELIEFASNWIPTDLKSFFAARSWIHAYPAFQGIIYSLQRERIFFVTKNGRMGTALDVIRPGDIVSLIAGLNMPFLLRESGEFYNIIAPAYVNGMMEGELWPEGVSEYHANHLGDTLVRNQFSLREVEIV